MNLLSSLLIASVATLTPAKPEELLASAPKTLDVRHEVILGHDTHSWTLELPAGVPTGIVVEGDGDSDLDAYLYDQYGNLIDSDDDLTDYCILEVVPLWTGEFTLEIVNRGDRSNLYELTID